MNIKIYKVNILINVAGDKEVMSFLRREFSFFEKKFEVKEDIYINIKYESFKIPKEAEYFGNNYIYYNKTIAQRIDGNMRSTWIVYRILPELGSYIEIYLSNKGNNYMEKMKAEIKRMFSLNFLYPWQNALIDFVHGPFIGILQLRLLNKSALFVHASSVGKIKTGLIFPGWAQSGKSTIVDNLVKQSDWKLLSEDLCILNIENEIIPYPKQRRFYIKQLRNTYYYELEKKFTVKIQDRMNAFIMKAFNVIGKESIRVLSMTEIFHPSELLAKVNLDSVVYIQRGEYSQLNLCKITSIKMAYICCNTMMAEMKNMTGFFDLISCYGIIKCLPNQVNKMFEIMFELYIKIFENKKCYLLNVPTYQTNKFIKEEINPILFELINANKMDV